MGIGTVERAYQLARDCSTVDELHEKLEREGCINVGAHLQGWLRLELKRLIEATH